LLVWSGEVGEGAGVGAPDAQTAGSRPAPLPPDPISSG
jgi:hypothetical protein